MNLASDNYSSGSSLSLEALDKKLSAKKPSRRPARAAKVDAARKMETASKLDNVSDSVLFGEDTAKKASKKKKKKKGDTNGNDSNDEYVEVPPPPGKKKTAGTNYLTTTSEARAYTCVSVMECDTCLDWKQALC